MTPFHTSLITHLIHPEWLEHHLNRGDIRILDARPADFYAESHIPNALSVNLNDFRHTHDGIEGLIIPPERFATLVGNLGIDENTLVVIYDDYHGLVASRLAWSFLRYGHTAVGLLDGGWDRWDSGGYPTTAIMTLSPDPKHFIPRLTDHLYASFDDVQPSAKHETHALLDVRSAQEFDKGHIPSAVQWDWQNGTAETAQFGDLGQIRRELADLGITPDQNIIVYCQSGVRASHTFFLLHHLGFNHVRMYDGSWAEWSVKQGV